MRIGSILENQIIEKRIAITPDIVKKYNIGEVIDSDVIDDISNKSLDKYIKIINNFELFQKNCAEASKKFDPILNCVNFRRL